MAEQDDDIALIRRWFQKLQLCVQTVDCSARCCSDSVTC